MPTVEIIGLGKSGIAAARLLNKNSYQVTIGDRQNSTKLEKLKEELEKENIRVKLGHNFTISNTYKPDLIVVSPGVPWDSSALITARNQGIEVIGEMELAWRYLKSPSWVGITGTNGKTTTTALIEAIFKQAGLNSVACGNIGYAGCELALEKEAGKLDWVIAEISSYQIESSVELSPQIGVWTTFTPDHLSRHKTMDNYYQIKANLLTRCEYQIFNGDDPFLYNLGLKTSWKNAYWTSINGTSKLIGEISKGVYINDAWISAFGELIAPISLFKTLGKHNLQNLLLAVAAAKLAGIGKQAIAEAISLFKGVAHRLELICHKEDVAYINDSKATNYDAAEVGLNAVNSPVILIAGGEAKEGDDQNWINKIKEKCSFVLLIGDAAEAFAKRFEEFNYHDYLIVETMEKAVIKAQDLAKKYQAKVVLLSPACASFDQYQSFEHRGDHFRQLCLNL